MAEERSEKIRELFLEALDVSQERRDEWLGERCGEDRELHHEVRELLDADNPTHDPLEAGIAGIVENELFSTSCPQCKTQWEVDELPREMRCPACDEPFVRANTGGLTLMSNDGKTSAVYLRGSGNSAIGVGVGNENSLGRRFGDYEIIERVAQGGMGVVYKARQTKLNRTVALKMIKSGELADQKQVDRFYSEAQAAAGLDHPGIVPVYEVGRQDDQHFYSMAFIEGVSLHDTVKNDGPLPAKRAAEAMKTVAEAVQFGHEKRIIHRDIKPQNILLDESGSPRVTDFGLAKHGDSEMTLAGEVMGTPSYMPPEQADGKHDEVGPVSDVYSLGATLYYVLTGRPPFQAASTTETLRQVINNEPVPPRRLNPDIPRDLETICLKCLRKERSSRYSTAGELAADLGRWLERKPIVARRVTALEKSWLWCKRKPVVVGLIAAVFVVITAGSFIAREQNNLTRAEELVVGLKKAEIDQVPAIISQLRDYRQWADPILKKQIAESREGSGEKLRLSLALLGQDEAQVEYLRAELLKTKDPAALPVIRDALKPHRTGLLESLWNILESDKQKAEVRFNAACALATFDGDNTAKWNPVLPFVAEQLVDEVGNSLGDTGRFLKMLKPIRKHLAKPVSMIIRDEQKTQLEKDIALTAVLQYAAGDPQRLADVLASAERRHYARVFGALKTLKNVDRHLAAVLREVWTEETPENEKERLARRQANAAVALLRLRKPEDAWPLLKHRPDPRTRSYIIHWAAPLGVDPEQLVQRFHVEQDDSIRRALVLALGEFDEKQLSNKQRNPMVKKLLAVYETDPDPGMHSCVAWLLRKWGDDKSIKEIVRKLQTNEEKRKTQMKNSQRHWYVNTQGQTFVVLKADVFRMGSPQSEPNRTDRETLHHRRIGRTFAIADCEVTKAQFRRFEQENRETIRPLNIDRWSQTDDSPLVGVDWFDAAAYCNWLSQKEGIPKDQWCYEENAKGKYAVGMKAKQNYLQLTGYRLPTEAEWEYACRAGTTTSRFFGVTESLLPYYVRYRSKRRKTWPVAGLKPNAFGLYDMLGNVMEWCHDLYAAYDVSDPKGTLSDFSDTSPVTKSARSLRGGAYVNPPSSVRSALRTFISPSFRFNGNGFRPARTYPPHGTLTETGMPQSWELIVLDRFVGTWSVKIVVKQLRGGEKKLTGNSINKWSSQRQSIESRFTGSDGTSTSFSRYTYDRDASVYRLSSLGSTSKQPVHFAMTWNKAKQTFTSKAEIVRGLTRQSTTRFIGNDRYEVSIVFKDASDKVVGEIHNIFTRKK